MSFRRPPSDVESMISLRVDNLPYRTHPEDLKPLFEKYGDVGDIYLPTERGTGRSRGFAFVRYYDRRDAEDALDELNGRTYDGRELRIKIDEGRPNRGGGGGRGGRYDDRDRGGRGGRYDRDRDYDSRDRGGRGRDRSDSRDRDRDSRRRRSRSDSRDRKERSRSHSRGRGRSGSKDRSKSRSRS
eukprot:TRINITY_DN32734_c0_g1_i1.p1 TRINITY_DN32734_c0_g1~~TRINITY_DN32734_c0_g1_i1.p1  ORF type:complete len:185 (-),score=41.44 TRINITY_DN32734_c0_g1_i1:142-696(-)